MAACIKREKKLLIAIVFIDSRSLYSCSVLHRFTIERAIWRFSHSTADLRGARAGWLIFTERKEMSVFG